MISKKSLKIVNNFGENDPICKEIPAEEKKRGKTCLSLISKLAN